MIAPVGAATWRAARPAAPVERRQAVRRAVKLLVAFQCLERDAPAQSGFARAASLSTGGACLESPDPFVVGQHLALQLLLDENRVAPVNAQVVWTNPRAPFYEIGVAFSKVPAKINHLIGDQIEG